MEYSKVLFNKTLSIVYNNPIITIGLSTPLLVTIGTPVIGFTSSGIVAGSLASKFMASYGGVVGSGSLCAALQSVGVVGLSTTSYLGLSSITVVTSKSIKKFMEYCRK
jgi:hypothetical protein